MNKNKNISTADEMTINPERVCQALNKNGDDGTVALDMLKTFVRV